MWTTPLGVGLAIAIAAALGGCDSDDGDAGAPRGDALVVIREAHHERADGAVYVEGAIQFVELTAPGADRPALKLELGRAPVVRTVEHGAYRLSSYTRTCESACSQDLDQPSGRCASQLSVDPGDRQAVRVVTVVGHRCQIRVEP